VISPEAMQDLLAHVSSWCSEHLAPNSLDEAEQAGVVVGREVGRVVTERGIASSVERFEQAGGGVECECGRAARNVGRRTRMLMTRSGLAQVERRYYHCAQCGAGYRPWDVAQGLGSKQQTPVVKSLICELAARLPYADTVWILERTTGLVVEESNAELIVAEVGGRARAEDELARQRAMEGEVSPEPQQTPKSLYVAVDGAHAHIDGSWHEVKVGVVYSEGGGKRYLAAREEAGQFGERVYAAAAEAGVEAASEVVALGDGAEWIWNLVATHLPGAIEIVDYWHACEHIHEVANAYWGEGTKAASRWAERHKGRLLEEGPGPLLRSLRGLRSTTAEGLKAVRLARGYFGRHRERMRYPQFERRGLSIGSGSVEAACKVIVGQRLRRAGMRWTDAGADHILALRCLVKSGDHHRLYEHSRAA